MNLTDITEAELLQDYWGFVHENVRRNGNKEFIITRKGSLTFAEVNQRANEICYALQDRLSLRGRGVGLYLSSPLDFIPAMIGVLKSGNYIVPLDVSAPENVLHSVMDIAEVKFLLTTTAYKEQLLSIIKGKYPLIDILSIRQDEVLPNPLVRYRPDDIVQIMFTSGSTGMPKGAVEDYRYWCRCGHKRTSSPVNREDDRVIEFSSFLFAAPHTKVIAALVMGFSLYYYNVKEDGLASLPEFIRANKLTVMGGTPTVIRSLFGVLKPGEVLPDVRRFSLGSEKKRLSDIESIRAHFPGVDGVGLAYSNTEASSVTSGTCPLDFDFSGGHFPCGKPDPNVAIYIWDEAQHALPSGEEGQIVVYGNSLAKGYINNPEMTRERFIPDPERPGWQYVLTGDLGRFLPDGQLEYIGRIDSMVKINGVRIELSSIENHILSYKGIVQAVANVFDDPRGKKRIAAYFVPEKGIEIPISDLRKHLADRLPLAQMPHYLVRLEELPHTVTGKVALTSLPLPSFIRPTLANPFEAPENELEKQLVCLWEEQIGINGIGVTDDFFEVGGDSLIGVLLFLEVEKKFGIRLPVSILLTAPTVRQQAALIDTRQAVQAEDPLIPIQSDGQGAPLFFIPGRGGYPTRIRHLAKKISRNTPVYALQDLTMIRGGNSLSSREGFASFYIQEIQKLYPHGPYLLVGESMGGAVAYEMAQQLTAVGESVPVLAMLDTYYEGSRPKYYLKRRRIPYFWMLIKKHLTIILKSDWQGKKDYIKLYLETFSKKNNRTLKPWPLGSPPWTDDVAMPSNLRKLEQNSTQAAREYKAKPYPGRVIYFKADREADHKMANGWEEVRVGELVVHNLDCYHGSILFEPIVSQVASLLQAHINESADGKAVPGVQ